MNTTLEPEIFLSLFKSKFKFFEKFYQNQSHYFKCFRFGSGRSESFNKMLHHEEQDRDVCIAEQEKSSESILKINKTKILDKMILPQKECWICEKTFGNDVEQLKHFSCFHECSLCGIGFEGIEVLKEHERNYHCQYCKKYFYHTIYKDDHQSNCEMKPRGMKKVLKYLQSQK